MARFTIPEFQPPDSECGECGDPIENNRRAYHCLYCGESTCAVCLDLMRDDKCILCGNQDQGTMSGYKRRS